ncbi:hypothetical protein OS242_05610 [Tumebacillus sp. DT12]|uniref:Uncharacterized protein n=1 Tax=Tumebacillus lacus TaxID=2995335 RepID=A0ABT3WXP3_9BACL|nr:hypothetical protein [Tumebacillus lacus]MCX7569430.1 hypothetical protein [Tumebacillus lacus]
MQEARNDSYAIYQGKEYKAGRRFRETKIVLFSRDRTDLNYGFEEFANGRYRKEVEPNEIESAYDVISLALYRGLKFQVINIDGDTILLYHSGPSLEREELGFRMVDRFEYEKEVHRSELEKMWEERTPLWGFQLPKQPDDNQ